MRDGTSSNTRATSVKNLTWCWAPSRCSTNIRHSEFRLYSGLIQFYRLELKSKVWGGSPFQLNTSFTTTSQALPSTLSTDEVTEGQQGQ